MKHAMILVLVLVVTGCSSRSSRAVGNGGEGGAAGASGAAGVAGGSAGATAGAGGMSGSGGGQGASAGAGGQDAGSGGTVSGGSGGQGAAAGSGGAGPTCTREEVFAVAKLPQSWVWQAFSLSWQGKCGFCAQTPCGTCTTNWFSAQTPYPPTWISDTVRVRFQPQCTNASQTTPAKEGTCGAETSCALVCGGLRSMELTLMENGDGYVVAAAAPTSTNSCASGTNGCKNMPLGYQTAVTQTQDADLAKSLLGLQFPCN